MFGGCSGTDKPVEGEIRLNSMFDADFDLVDHDEQSASDERFEGKPMLIYFGFTACPDICPAALGNMTATLDRLGPDAEDIHALFITVDPERDTPTRLKNHLAYDPRILGLTGSDEALTAARDALNVYAAKVPLPDSAMEYTMDHQRLFYLTDASGMPVVATPDATAPEQLEKIIRRHL
ncbi:MAG: SCO family protein [Pseudomonadota bacterium]